MSWHDRALTLAAKSRPASDAPAIVDWAAAHPGGSVYFADGHTGTALAADATTQYDRGRIVVGDAIRAEAARRGVAVRLLLGLRPDVVQPLPFIGRADPDLDPAWVLRAGVPTSDVEAAWQRAGYRTAWKLNAAWMSAVASLGPDPALYGMVASATTLEVVGMLADLASQAYRDWLVDYTRRALAAYGADGIVAGVKPWQRGGTRTWLTPETLTGHGNLLQPTPWKPGHWEAAISAALTDLSAVCPVVAQTRPQLEPYRMGLGGTVVERVTGEQETAT